MDQSYTNNRRNLDNMWFVTDTPASSDFVPFYANATGYAKSYRSGHMGEFNLECAWWVFDFVATWMNLSYRMMNRVVSAKIAEMQDYIDELLPPAEREATKHFEHGQRKKLCRSCRKFRYECRRMSCTLGASSAGSWF